jgi:hypothetical protein
MTIKAVLKEEFEDIRPDSQYPQWFSTSGETADHLRERMAAKGCNPERYEWSDTSGGYTERRTTTSSEDQAV